jgi:galactokinase
MVSDLPPAAGMSSSSALMVGIFLAMAAVNKLDQRAEYKANIDGIEALASYLGTVENGQSFGTLVGSKGVGTFGGSEDHTAILCGRSGQLSCYSYFPVRLEGHVALPNGFVFAIGSSGVVAAKTGAAREKYNRVSRLVSVGLEVWNAATGRNDKYLAAALGSSEDAVDQIRKILGQAKRDDFSGAELLKRFEHFVAENNEIIPTAIAALSTEDVSEFGRQVDRSQELSETLLGNQVANTVFLAKSARELGAVAASAFGAGFGGAVWAMVKEGDTVTFLEEWKGRYRDEYPEEGKSANFFVTRPGPATLRLEA